MSDLPVGWNESTIVNLIGKDGLFSDGDWVESKDQDPNGAIRLLQLADIGDGKFVNKSHRFVNDKKFELLNFTEILEDDVLVARMPDPLGRACLMPKLPQKCITVVDVAIIRPGKDSVLPRWLMHFLNSPEIRQRIELLSSGTTRKRISRGNLAQIELPIPPLNEQKRIAEKLDSLLARVDSCQTHLERVPQILKRFRQSVLAAVVTGRLSGNKEKEGGQDLPKDWRWVKLTEITSQVKDADHKMPKPAVSDIPYVSTKDFINHDDIDFENAKHISEEDFISLTKKIKPEYDDILLSRYGTVGEVRKVKTNQRFQASYSIAIIKPIHDLVLTDFLVAVLRSDVGQEQMRQNIQASSQPDLGLENIRKFNIPLPPIEEQAEIVRRAEKLFAYAERLEARYTSASEHVERLTPSLLAKAFRGELVEQDAGDESAAELLEKIRAQNVETQVVKLSKGKKGGKNVRKSK